MPSILSIYGENEEESNKNYYLVRNAGSARSRYTLKLSLIFLINQSINELTEYIYNGSSAVKNVKYL